MKTIFSKYSNERCPEFCIKTSIVEDNQGKRSVRKYPVGKSAFEHVERLPLYCEKINNYYGNIGFKAADCTWQGNYAEFEYIKGITFEEKLENVSDNINIVFEYINNLKNTLINSEYTKPFIRSREFDNVFGTIPLPEGLHAMDFTCFDMAFNNLIINGDKLYIIDYEWCFDFQIPVEYVIYRALKLYTVLNNKNELIDKDIYAYLGFDKHMLSAFDVLEENFQAYVHRGAFITRNLYEKYKGKNYNLSEIIALYDEKEKLCWAQTYIDYGRGYNEKDSYKRLFKYGEDIDVNIVLTKDAAACRFDPEIDSCIMVIKQINACSSDGMYEPPYWSNGCESHGVIYFTQTDPYIVFDKLREGTTAVQISCRVYPLSSEHIEALAKAVFDNKELNAVVEDQRTTIENIKADNEGLKENIEGLKEDIERLKADIEAQKNINNSLNNDINTLNSDIFQKEQHILAIENSRAWKIVSMVRRILGR